MTAGQTGDGLRAREYSLTSEVGKRAVMVIWESVGFQIRSDLSRWIHGMEVLYA